MACGEGYTSTGAWSEVGLGLQQQAAAGQAAVDPQPRQRRAEVAPGGVRQQRHLRGDSLDRGAHEMAAFGAERQPGERRLACGFQYGAARPASAGTKVTPAGAVDASHRVDRGRQART